MSKRPLFHACLLVLACSITLAVDGEPRAGQAVEARVERRLLAMDTTLDLAVVAADRETALRASEAAWQAIRETELLWSSWLPDSVLSALNERPVGQPLEVPESLSSGLRAVQRCSRRTEGAFDPSLGTAGGAGLPLLEEVAPSTWLRKHSGVRVDVGGFAKGLGLDAALEALASAGATRATADLGGQSVVQRSAGGAAGGWQVDVADPADRSTAVLRLSLDGGSVATSGLSEHRAHIIDPSTGGPVGDRGSLTVVAASAMLADCLSTGLYVAGAERALAWAATSRDFDVVVLSRDAGGLTATVSQGLAGRAEALVDGLRLVEHAHGGPSRRPAAPDPTSRTALETPCPGGCQWLAGLHSPL